VSSATAIWLGSDGDARQVESRLHRLGIGAARADRAFDAPEQVHLITDVEPDVIGLALDRPCPQRTRLARVGAAGAHARRRQAPGARFAQHRARLRQIGGGDAQVGVRGQRVGHQLVEQGIAEQAPPRPRRLLAAERGRLARLEERGLRRRRGDRRDMARPDGAGRERQRARRGDQHRTGHQKFSTGTSPPLVRLRRNQRLARSPRRRQRT
jgi:hypothetical protein